MKSIRSFILIAIGMMAFTATANTAALEQKQKPELAKEFTFQANTVCVINYQLDSVFTVSEIFVNNDVLIFKSNDSVKSLAILIDVGWQIPDQRFIKIPYQEKLLENYNKDFIDRINKDGNPIRDNC